MRVVLDLVPDVPPTTPAEQKQYRAKRHGAPVQAVGIRKAGPLRRPWLVFPCVGFVEPIVRAADGEKSAQTRRSTISFFNSAMALAGFNPLGQALAQFKIVWQR